MSLLEPVARVPLPSSARVARRFRPRPRRVHPSRRGRVPGDTSPTTRVLAADLARWIFLLNAAWMRILLLADLLFGVPLFFWLLAVVLLLCKCELDQRTRGRLASPPPRSHSDCSCGASGTKGDKSADATGN